VNLPTGALFVPDTATYLPNAEALVRSQAAEFEPDTGSIPVSASATGHCATWGNAADARTLSLQRAQKVVATLVAAGVSRSLFTTISGVGFDQLVVPDLTSGNVLIPDKAELNRTVVLTVKRVGRTQ
jgi:outer membrane protein OmpA-like peptidoglycan-associated protein